MKVVGGTDYDPWNTEADGPAAHSGQPRRRARGANDYDPDEFYVRSTNKHDHSEQTRLRIPGDVLAELGALIASKDIPEYRTISDFFRDAAVHRLHYIAEMSGSERMMYLVQTEVRAARIDAAEREAAANQAIVDGWGKRVKAAKDGRDEIGLGKAREFIQDDIEWIREPYRSMLVEIYKTIEITT